MNGSDQDVWARLNKIEVWIASHDASNSEQHRRIDKELEGLQQFHNTLETTMFDLNRRVDNINSRVALIVAVAAMAGTIIVEVVRAVVIPRIING